MELIKLLIVFLLILILLGFKKPLYWVMPGATILLAVFFKMAPLDFLLAYGKSLISPTTIDMLLILWFIMVLEEVMSSNGYMERMLSAMDNLFHSRKVDIVTMPMIIGFLPSAGGALFSAPMVAHSSVGSNLSPESKTIINIHYRHVMETFFPTYPGLILASQLAGVPLFSLMGMMLPLTIFSFFIGLFFVRNVQNDPNQIFEPISKKHAWAALFTSMWPFLLLIGQIMILQINAWIAAMITLVALLAAIRPPINQLPFLIKKATKIKLLLMVITVLAFKDILNASGAVTDFPQIIAQLPIPAFLVFSLSTLVASVVTGMEMPAISLTMPLAIAAMPGIDSLPLAALMVLSAYVGAQITPMHICISIVADYFNANLQKVILKSLPMYILIYLIGLFAYNLIV